MVYQKCLEENQDTLTAERVIEISMDLYNSDRLSKNNHVQDKDDTLKDKDQEGMKRRSCYCCGTRQRITQPLVEI